jgi:hypothetical protein
LREILLLWLGFALCDLTASQRNPLVVAPANPLGMKKASGKLGSKPSRADPYSFMDELSESKQLQQRLRTIVHELKAAVELLERNLQEAHSSTHLRHEATDGAGGRVSGKR